MNLYLLISILLVCTADAAAVFCITQVKKTKLPKLLRKTALLLASALLLLCSLDSILSKFTLHSSTGAPIVTLAVVVAVYSVVTLVLTDTNKPLQKFLHQGTLLVVLSLVLEFAVFCAPCYGLHPTSESVPVVTSGVKLPDQHAETDGPDIVISGTAELVFPIERENVKYISFSVDSVDEFWKGECLITDENFSKDFQRVGLTWMNPSQHTLTFAVNPHKTLHEVKIKFYNVEKEPAVRLRSMTVMNVKPFAFSLLRFLLLAGVLCLLCAIRCFGLHKITYDSKNLFHREAVLGVLLLSIIGMFLVAPNGITEFVDYNMEEGMGNYDPYAQTFDAWQHGQLHFRVETDPALLEVENPYDRNERDASGASILWDKAFYEGKYYSYFGVTPVVFVYYPVYFLTGKIPTAPMTAMVFSVLGMCFLFLTMLSAVKKYGKDVNLLLLLCGLVSAAAASGLFFCAHYADRYYAVIAAGICFLFLYLWLGLEACMAEKQTARCLYLGGCGFAIACAVLSRPTLSLYAVLLIPPFLELIRRNTLSKHQKLTAVASFGVPLMIGAAVTMAYNAARFSSPFDFGAAYQLTVSNTSANIVRLSDFPSAIVHYFLTPFEVGGVFPYISRKFLSFDTQSHYTYITSGFGACMYPVAAAGYLLFWMATKGKGCSVEKRWIYRLAFLVPVLIAFLDFCMGGYVDRYLCDILPVLSVFAALLLLEVQGRLRRFPTLAKDAGRIFVMLLLLSPVVTLAVFLSSGEHFTMWRTYPYLYFDLRDLLIFWR